MYDDDITRTDYREGREEAALCTSVRLRMALMFPSSTVGRGVRERTA